MSIINEDPELIESEIRRSLLMAAVGGEYTEEEISVDGKGKTKVKHVKKNALPDVSAAKELLNILGGNENSNLKINSGTVNIEIDHNAVPVIGQVTVNV